MNGALRGRQSYRRWMDYPISKKAALLLGVLLGVMWLIVFAIVQQLRTLSNASGSIMEGYIEITNFMNAFSSENILMEAYVRPNHTEEDEEVYRQAAEETDEYLIHMRPDLATDSHEEYMLKRAITNAMVNYRTDHFRLLKAPDAGEEIARYLLLERQAIYINQYNWELLQVRLLAGENKWQSLMSVNRRNSRLLLLYMFCGTAISILVVVLLMRNILHPLVRLGKAADAISEGIYDNPPLAEDRGDEIGRAAHSFNLMQNQVRQTIHAMEREAEMEKENARITEALQESRYAELQSQINPHFLFNTLNTIAAMAAEEEAPVAEELILRLSKFFRYSLESREKTVLLSQELQVLQDYTELMDARFAGRIQMTVAVSDKAPLDVRVPKFILQPIVENAVIHGLRDVAQGGEIHVTVDADAPALARIVIEDNGCGFDPVVLQMRKGKETEHTSVGLDNIAERLKMTGGSLLIDSRAGEGTRVILTIGKEAADD